MSIADTIAKMVEAVMPTRHGETPSGGPESKVGGIIHASFNRAQMAQADAHKEQWYEIRQALDYSFKDAFVAYLQSIHPERSKDFAEQDFAGNRYLPLIPMIASRLAVSFHTPPETYLYRMIDGEEVLLEESDPQTIQWRKDYKDAKLDTVLAQIDQWTTVLRQCLVMPAKVRNRIVWSVYSPDELIIDQDEVLPEEIEHARQVSIEMRQPADPSATKFRGHQSPVETHYTSWRYDEDDDGNAEWSVWYHDKSGHLLNRNGEQWRPLFRTTDENEYKCHPFVMWRAQEPQPREVFLPPREDWLQAQHGANENLTDADLGLRLQTHAQAQMKGVPTEGTEPVLGVTRILVFPKASDGGLSYVAPPVDLAELRETLNQKLRALAVAEDLPTDTWEANSSTRNFMAKMVEAFQLIVRQGRVRPAYRQNWDATTRIHMKVGNHWAKDMGRVTFGEDVRVGIRFAELPWPQDRFQQAQTAQLEYAQGRRDPVEDIMTDEGVQRATAQRLYDDRKGKMPAEAATDAPPDAVGAVVADTDIEPTTAETAETAELSQAAFNGAQVTAAISVIESVNSGVLTRSSGLAILEKMFALDEATALRLMATAGQGGPKAPKTPEE